jgi:hypothetical protein
MSVHDRIASILAHARVAGGWIDEDVASAVLAELGLDHHGKPVDAEPKPVDPPRLTGPEHD